MKKTLLIVLLLLMSLTAMAAESVAPLNPEYVRWAMSGMKSSGYAGGRIPVPVSSFYIPAEEPLFKQGELPAKYDLRSEGKVSPIRNQGSTNTCWTFGAMASMEGSWLMDNPYGTIRYSTFNIVRNTADAWGVDIGSGGHYLISTSYFARLLGPVYDSEDPFDPTLSSGLPPALSGKPKVRAYMTEAEYIPDHLMHNTSILVDGEPSKAYMEYIKRSIMSKGVIDVSYCHSNSYLNSSKGAYYCDYPYSANHEISIIGWDDNYSRSNFNKTAPDNGAWLARNSWGEDWCNGGYFWISYYDQSACDFCQFSLTTDLSRYSRVYEHEAKGLWTSGSYNWARDTYTMKQDGKTVEAGTYCMVGGNTLRCTVYVNGTKAASGEKYCKYPGYYLIPVKASFAKGDKVVCQIQYADSRESGKFYTPLTNDLSLSAAGACQLSTDGSSWDDSREAFDVPYANCIKLYTKDASSAVAVTGVSLDKTSLSLKKGDA